jgi:hypothetical protein
MHSQICYRTSVLCQSGQRPNVASVSKSLPGERFSQSTPVTGSQVNNSVLRRIQPNHLWHTSSEAFLSFLQLEIKHAGCRSGSYEKHLIRARKLLEEP